MVTRQIESSQKKVEERFFEQRKHLLEYDEVMDEQRKRVYTYRQAILEGANCRNLILDMIDRQLALKTEYFTKSSYRWETVVSWAKQQCGLELKQREVRDMQPDQLTEFLRDRADRQAYERIREQIEDSIPRDVDPREQNWQALSKWANMNFALNTNDRELKKVAFVTEGDPTSLDTGKLHEYLYERALETINKFDFNPVTEFLDEKWGRQSLCEWLKQQYGIEMKADQFWSLSSEDATKLIKKEIEALYHRREIELPVLNGLSHFMVDHSGVARYNRQGLAEWATQRFQTPLPFEEIEGKSKADIAQILFAMSAKYYSQGAAVWNQIEGLLNKAYGDSATPSYGQNGSSAAEHTVHVVDQNAVKELAEVVGKEFNLQLIPEKVAESKREVVEGVLRSHFEQKYRHELHAGERHVTLDTLDTSWKDHLYFMDQLKSGIGLVGYAQKDPKVEYRREGMRAFEHMWDRIAAQVTGTIFRISVEVQEPTADRWQITSQVHEAPAPDIPDDHPALENQGGGQGTSPKEQAVEPIRNYGNRVGRNDPCPCGSGKKYKKCHGAN